MSRLPIPFGNPATYPGHSGVDFGQPRGTIFRASGPGAVTTRAHNSRGGYYIWVRYDNGPHVGYHHMDSHVGCPPVGARVSEGTQLGYVGNSGRSTGPHLHSEVEGHATTDGYWQFFDASRVVGSSSGGGAQPSSGGGVPVTPSQSKEDDTMYSVQINGNQYGLAKQFITHYGDARQAKITRQVTSVADELHNLGNGTGASEPAKNWGALLDGLGIPRTVLDAQGRVLNPQSGKFESNGTWSREREILAALAKK